MLFRRRFLDARRGEWLISPQLGAATPWQMDTAPSTAAHAGGSAAAAAVATGDDETYVCWSSEDDETSWCATAPALEPIRLTMPAQLHDAFYPWSATVPHAVMNAPKPDGLSPGSSRGAVSIPATGVFVPVFVSAQLAGPPDPSIEDPTANRPGLPSKVQRGDAGGFGATTSGPACHACFPGGRRR